MRNVPPSSSAAARVRASIRSPSCAPSRRCRSAANARLIDVPISNCLHADLRRIFVLTQFNSASLNRHVSRAYRMDQYSRGFVESSRGRADATVHELVPGDRRRRPQGPATFPGA